MKKTLALVLVLVGVLTVGFAVFADTEDVPEWFTEMIEWRKAQVEESLEAGLITEDQAEAWFDHFDDMTEFHQENGFGGGGFGGCRGGRGFGPGAGMGPGFGWNQQQ